MCACFLITLAAIQLALGPKLQLSQWGLPARNNAGVAEAVAWLNGRLDIPHDGRDAEVDRMHDTAYYNGRVYNVFPPLVGFLTYALAPLHKLALGGYQMWLQTPYVMLYFWPLPILGFFVFRRETGDAAWAGLLTLAWMGGSALLPNLEFTRTGHLGAINHVSSQTGLLLLAADLLGRQRIWPGLIGLAVAAWSRQMTFLYAIPLMVVAWKRRRLGACMIGLAAIAAPFLIFNQLKFGNPLDFGYRHIYVGRGEEIMATRCREHGTFSPHFITENLWYIFVAPPRIDEISLIDVKIESAGAMGTGLFPTTPWVAVMLLGIRQAWRDRTRRLLLLSTLPVIFGLLLYHSPGYAQIGHSRFSLDFLPIWMAALCPFSCRGRRGWALIGLSALALLYFQAMVPNAPLPAKYVGPM